MGHRLLTVALFLIASPPYGWYSYDMRIPLLIVVAAFCLSMAGCNAHMIDARAIAPLMLEVNARHDAYVNTDESLAPVQKSVYLRSSKQLTDLVNAAAGGVQ